MTIEQIDQDTDLLCGSTSATYTPTNKRRSHNIAYQDVARLIWESDGSWSFDDSNNTDTPVAYKTLGNASATYTVPTNAFRIEAVEIKDNNGDWQKLEPINLNDLGISREEYLSAAGLPVKYALEGVELRLFPPPSSNNVTLASGMAVRLNRMVTEIPVSATTSTPGFASPFHRILSYAAALDFTRDEQDRKFFLSQKIRLENGLTKFYSHRAQEMPSQIRPVNRKKWRRYL